MLLIRHYTIIIRRLTDAIGSARRVGKLGDVTFLSICAFSNSLKRALGGIGTSSVLVGGTASLLFILVERFY